MFGRLAGKTDANGVRRGYTRGWRWEVRAVGNVFAYRFYGRYAESGHGGYATQAQAVRAVCRYARQY
jgi:hypothetical protein